MSNHPFDDDAIKQILTASDPLDQIPFAQTPQGLREQWINEGFTGTFAELIEWMDHALMNGAVRLAQEPEPDPLSNKRLVRRLELVSGGFSTAELAMSRLREGMLGFYWESSHRGGLDVYLVPENVVTRDAAVDWVLPASTLVFSAMQARTLRIETLEDSGDPDSEPQSIAVFGAEVAYEEDPDDCVARPAGGTLVVRIKTNQGA